MDEQLIGRLRIQDIFRGLDDQEIRHVVEEGEIEEKQAGDIVYHLGDKLDYLYIVIQGRLIISSKAPGGDFQTVRYVGPGDQFGMMMLLSEDFLPIQVTVDERVVMLKIHSENAQKLSDEYPLLRRNLFRRLGLSFKGTLLDQQKRNPAKLVIFCNVDDECRQVIAEITKQLGQYEKIGILGNQEKDHEFEGRCRIQPLTDEHGTFITPERIRETLYNWDDIERVFFIADESVPQECLNSSVELADIVFCLSTTEKSTQSVKALKQLYAFEPSWKTKCHFVWVLNNEEQVAPLVKELPSLVERDFKVHLATSGELARLRTQGITRLVHYLRGVSIGLALSGGAAHGMAHLGVLKALDEAGITIDRVAGTSAGVLTGIVYCAGKSPDFGIDQFAKDLKPGSIYRHLPMGDGFYMLGKYRGNKWDPMLRKYFSNWCLEQLPIPLCSVATDLISAEPVVRDSGDAVQAVLESINLPILSEPKRRDGKLLIDGMFVDNLPADVLVKQGCKFVIGVDVAKNIEKKFGVNTPDTPAGKMKIPGLVATLVRCMQIQAHNLSEVGSRAADVIIAPDVSKFDPTAFVKASEMAAIGYDTTLKSLPRIREILAELDSGLFGQ